MLTVWARNAAGPAKNNFDADHEGYLGRADQILSGADGRGVYVPDVVLLHTGTNNMLQSENLASTVDEITQTVSSIQTANPEVTILLAQIIGVDRGVNLSASLQVQELSAAIRSLNLGTRCQRLR